MKKLSAALLLAVAACSAPPPSIVPEVDAGGSTDAGTGGFDAGMPSDAGGLTDAGRDAGTDAGVPDAGGPDAGSGDAGTPDGGVADAGMPDAGGAVDAGIDAGVFADAGPGADAGVPDAGAPDAGGPPFDIEGFGAGTVGGWQFGSTNCLVTNLNDDGPGSLRECTRSMNLARVVTFSLDGRIALSSPIDLPSNISIDGTGHDVGVSGKGFWVHGQSQVILHRIAIEGVGPNSEDGIQIGFPNMPPAHHVVLDHVKFAQTGNGGDSANVDEAISVIFGAHSVTVAWCRFSNWEKVLLAGNGDADAAVDGNISVTMHHNLFENTGRRHPRARYGRFDVYNNYLYRWHAYDWFYLPPYRDSYGSWCQSDCQMRLENNIYEKTIGSKDLGTNANDAWRCTEGGKIVQSGAYVTPSTTAPLQFGTGCPANPTVFARPYAATVEPANAMLGTKLFMQTGN